MRKGNVLKAILMLIVGMVMLAGCEGDPGPAGPAGADGTESIPAAYTSANGITGGAAYSKWWTTDGGGSGTQPTTTAAADFYRCKSCHAWDGFGNAASYANRTGQSTLKSTRPDVASINLRGSVSSTSLQKLFDLIKRDDARKIDASDNSHPDYSTHLSDAQTWNIIKFMREEWVAPNLLYDIEVSGPAMHVDYSADPDTLVEPTITFSNVGALGNEANGQSIVTSKCASCHGSDGTTLDIGGRSLGQFIREKPHEAWLKAKFGESGTGMNPGLVSTTSDLQDMYKALANSTNFPDL